MGVPGATGAGELAGASMPLACADEAGEDVRERGCWFETETEDDFRERVWLLSILIWYRTSGSNGK